MGEVRTAPIYDDAPTTWPEILRATRDNECCCDTCEGIRNLAATGNLPVRRGRRWLYAAVWLAAVSSAVTAIVLVLALTPAIDI